MEHTREERCAQAPTVNDAQLFFGIAGLLLLITLGLFSLTSDAVRSRELIYFSLAVIITQINLLSWRAFVHLCTPVTPGIARSGRSSLLDLFLLKSAVLFLLVLIFLKGGVLPLEITLAGVVINLLSGALLLAAFQSWRNRRDAHKFSG